MQFHVYIWSISQHHNIYNYLDQIQHEKKIFINQSKVLDQEFCMHTFIFYQINLTSLFFIKSSTLFFMYLYTHVDYMLNLQMICHKILFNGSFSAIFLEFFDNFCGDDHYLLGTIFPYLESLHFSKYGASTFVQHNLFGRIKYINRDDLGQYKVLFVKRSNGCKPSFCNNVKLKMKQKL